jgi:hypothetical protein
MFVYSFVNTREYEKFWSVDEEILDSDNPGKAYNCFGYDSKLLEKTINECNITQAKKFMTFVSYYLPDDILSSIHKKSECKKLPDPYYSWGIQYKPKTRRIG